MSGSQVLRVGQIKSASSTLLYFPTLILFCICRSWLKEWAGWHFALWSTAASCVGQVLLCLADSHGTQLTSRFIKDCFKTSCQAYCSFQSGISQATSNKLDTSNTFCRRSISYLRTLLGDVRGWVEITIVKNPQYLWILCYRLRLTRHV